MSYNAAATTTSALNDDSNDNDNAGDLDVSFCLDDTQQQQQQQQQQETTEVTSASSSAVAVPVPAAAKAEEAEQDDDESMCPICLLDDVSLAHGPCRHTFCRDCLERLLFAPRQQQQQEVVVRPPAAHNATATMAAPTIGSCPVCRAELYLFDLKDAETGEALYQKDHDFLDNENNSNNNAALIAGAVYVDQSAAVMTTTTNSTLDNNGIGYGSFHFDATPPYYNVEHLPLPYDRIPFQNAHWHAPTRTFAGNLVFDENDDDDIFAASPLFSQWDVFLSFSNDGQFIRTGAIRKRRRSFESIEEMRRNYPLRGTWLMMMTTNNSNAAEQRSVEIHVQGNNFYDARTGAFYVIKLQPRQQQQSSTGTDDVSPFKKKAVLVGGTARPFYEASSWDCEADPTGPAVGQELEWTPLIDNNSDHDDDDARTNNNRSASMVWKRQTEATQLPPDEINYVGGMSGRIYRRWHSRPSTNHSLPPAYHPNTVWGNTFCQALKVGLASYHFVSPDEVYISYEHPATGQWPPLDNGMPVPSRVAFHNVTIIPDDPHLTFRGSIQWEADYGTSWQGMAQWDYDIKFDSAFTCILSGTVTSISVDGESRELSRYGETLVYVNAALFSVFRQEQHPEPSSLTSSSSSSSSSTRDAYNHFRIASQQLRQRLQQEGASVRTLAMIHSILTAAAEPEGINPIDLNLSQNVNNSS